MIEIPVRYSGESSVQGERIHLSPNLRRNGVELRARLRRPLPFRDAMLALRECVLSRLHRTTEEILASLDPVVTVTPVGVFFEAFSQDESTYGRVTLRPEALTGLSSTSFGCTNVQFSEALARGLRELRSTGPAVLEVGLESLAVNAAREEKIRLPEGWVQGFLEIQAAQRLPGTMLDLHPRDLGNLLNYLRRRKGRVSPRSLRFTLRPGAPPTVTVEPWNHRIEFRASRHDAVEEREIRLWGRRRLLLLSGVLPRAGRVRALLQGTGRPSFWRAELPEVVFLLGLTPWSAREWTIAEAAAPFWVPPVVSPEEVDRVAAWLEERLVVREDELGLSQGKARAALDRLCLRGRALYDLESGCYLARRLLDQDPPEPSALGPRREEARRLAEQGRVSLERSGDWWEGAVRGRSGLYPVRLQSSPSGAVLAGACGCPFFARFSLQRGPCKHLLAAALVAGNTRSDA